MIDKKNIDNLRDVTESFQESYDKMGFFLGEKCSKRGCENQLTLQIIKKDDKFTLEEKQLGYTRVYGNVCFKCMEKDEALQLENKLKIYAGDQYHLKKIEEKKAEADANKSEYTVKNRRY